jgi:hypothetical protein
MQAVIEVYVQVILELPMLSHINLVYLYFFLALSTTADLLQEFNQNINYFS